MDFAYFQGVEKAASIYSVSHLMRNLPRMPGVTRDEGIHVGDRWRPAQTPELGVDRSNRRAVTELERLLRNARGNFDNPRELERAHAAMDRIARHDIEPTGGPESPGQPILRLGLGGENESVLMAHPHHGIHVAKFPSPHGLATASTQQHLLNALGALRRNPDTQAHIPNVEPINNFADLQREDKHHAADPRNPLRTPALRMPFILGPTGAEATQEQRRGLPAAAAQVTHGAPGYNMQDIDPATSGRNWVRTPQGVWQMIDALAIPTSSNPPYVQGPGGANLIPDDTAEKYIGFLDDIEGTPVRQQRMESLLRGRRPGPFAGES